MPEFFLSPHELATLIVVHATPDEVQHVDPDAVSLLHAELVKLIPAVSGRIRLAVTLKGREVLRRFGSLAAARGYDDVRAAEAFESY